MGYRVKEIIFFVKAWGDRSLKHSVLCRFCGDDEGRLYKTPIELIEDGVNPLLQHCVPDIVEGGAKYMSEKTRIDNEVMVVFEESVSNPQVDQKLIDKFFAAGYIVIAGYMVMNGESS